MTGVLRRRESPETHREECHVNTEVEMGVMHLHVKEHQALPSPTRN